MDFRSLDLAWSHERKWTIELKHRSLRQLEYTKLRLDDQETMMEDPNKSPHPDARARLLAHFSAKNTEDHPTGWDELWGQNFVPWDKGSGDRNRTGMLD